MAGAALLLHGLTDSPYSLRQVGEILHQQGFYVLGLRLPGHGTIPNALTSADYQDWMAVTRMGVEHVKAKIGNRGPFFLVGYSNGGALAVKYTLEAAENSRLAMPDRLILFSPAIGITPFSVFAGWHKVLSIIPYFEKYKWRFLFRLMIRYTVSKIGKCRVSDSVWGSWRQGVKDGCCSCPSTGSCACAAIRFSNILKNACRKCLPPRLNPGGPVKE